MTMPVYSFAAIGIIWKDTSKREVLLMKHRSGFPHGLMGEWFFPGGIVEYGERAGVAAAREVQEETGIISHDLVLSDISTYREAWKDGEVEKTVDVVLAIYEGWYATGELTKGDESDDVAWVARSDLGKYLSPRITDTYLPSQVRTSIGLE